MKIQPAILILCFCALAHAQTPVASTPAQRTVTEVTPGVPTGAGSADAATSGNRIKPLTTLASLGADYKIGSNDLMDVEVYGVPELRRSVRVNSSGQVSLALIGNVEISGMTAEQAEKEIAKKYAQKYLQNPEVSIFIKEFTTQRITVEGAVSRPGIYPITGTVTLLRVMAIVGGGGGMADLSTVTIYRTPEKGGQLVRHVYDIDKIRSGDELDPVIMAEDVIVVRRDGVRAALRDSLFRDVIDSINPFSVLAPK